MTADPSRANWDSTAPQSLNGYAYANDDPANGTDPTGLYTNIPPCMTYACLMPGPPGAVAGSYYAVNAANNMYYGGGGGAATNRNANVRGEARAEQALTDKCAQFLAGQGGPENGTTMIGKLENVTISDVNLGASQYTLTESADGGYSYTSTAVKVGNAPGDGTIQLNSNAQLSNLSQVLVGTLSNGTNVYDNMLTSFENAFGLKSGSLDTSTYWAIYLLHELGHVVGGLPSDKNSVPQSLANTQGVVDNCFASLKK